jgi:hypothetical protein
MGTTDEHWPATHDWPAPQQVHPQSTLFAPQLSGTQVPKLQV